MTRVRKFGKHAYTLKETWRYKSDAQEMAHRIRETGYPARVTKNGQGYYDVWVDNMRVLDRAPKRKHKWRPAATSLEAKIRSTLPRRKK